MFGVEVMSISIIDLLLIVMFEFELLSCCLLKSDGFVSNDKLMRRE